MQNNRLLTSLLLFRGLYDNNKRNIYQVLADFLKNVILQKNIQNFDTREITTIFNKEYDFTVPEAIIKTALGRINFLERKDNIYSFNDKEKEDFSLFEKKYQEAENKNNSIIEELVKYINEKKGESKGQEDQITQAFCSYIIDDNEQEYSNLISSFIIKNKNKEDFTQKLNIMKEGVILYSGIKYTSELNEVGSWNTELTIYLETEILFSLFGYNGELYKEVFDDLFLLILEINNSNAGKGKPELIKLKYFAETNDEIEHFFAKAEQILLHGERVDPSKPAMIAILKECTTPSDIVAKKTSFFSYLGKRNITLDKGEYYCEEKNIYNIEDEKLIKKIKEENENYDVGDIERSLKFLNYINILRKGENKVGFENIKYILLTAKNITKEIAIQNIKEEGAVPLITSINWLTNKFWFKLNKGFGNDSLPKTFSIITKAQIILSNQINKTVSAGYDKLKLDKNLSKEDIIATLAGLRENALKPEEINEKNIDNVLCEISEDDISHFLRERSLLKAENEKKEVEIKQKDITIKKQKERISQLLPYEERNKKIVKIINRTIDFIPVGILIFLIITGVIFVLIGAVELGALLTIIGSLSFFGINIKKVKNLLRTLLKKLKIK